MSDALPIPQLMAQPIPAAARQDAAQPATDAQADGDVAQRPFAEVLKSKSDAGTADTDDTKGRNPSPDDTGLAQLDPSLADGLATIAWQDGNPLAPQLLAQLTAALPGTLLSAKAPATPMVSDITADLASDHLEDLGPANAASLPTAVFAMQPAIAVTPESVLPSDGAMPATAIASVLPPPMARAMTNASGPSAVATDPHAAIAGEEYAAGASARAPQLAAPTAISADGGKPGVDRPLPLPETAELRPLAERASELGSAYALHAARANLLPSQPAGDTVPLRVVTPFAQPGWAQEVDQKLTWVLSSGRQQADLVLNPPQLGRIEVTLVVEADQVNASFASPHQAVREAIEESLVRLRESLADSGVNLGQTHVGRDSSRDAPFMRPDDGGRRGDASRHEASNLTMPLAQGSAWQPSRGRGMVDVFA